MPYKNKADRDANHYWEFENKRPGAHEARMERQRARRASPKPQNPYLSYVYIQ